MAEKFERQFWGGFIGGKLDVRTVDEGFGGWGQERHDEPALYTSRWQARRHYEDVRRVNVSLIVR